MLHIPLLARLFTPHDPPPRPHAVVPAGDGGVRLADEGPEALDE